MRHFRMLRRSACAFLIFVSLSGGAVRGSAAPAKDQPIASERPDIILIVLDDVGFSDLGAFGSEIATPNIDALAHNGLRYTRFDTKAVCSPTRAALLTGRNSQTVRMADLPARAPTDDQSSFRGELPDNAQTVADALRSAGYGTYAVGKWHLAPAWEDGSPGKNRSWPRQRGFDRFYGFLSGWTDQFHPSLVEDNRKVATPSRADYHFSADIVDRAIDDLRFNSRQASGKPAFLYLAFGAAHAPIQVPRPYIDRYAGTYEKGWDVLREERLKRMIAMGVVPQSTQLSPINSGDRRWSSLSETERKVYARFMATYAGFITHADEQIGRLIDYLKASGRYDNTLILLASDNGAAGEAGQTGSFEKLYRPNNMTPSEMLARIDTLGSAATQAQYQRPWAMLGATPFRRYKIWPFLGGVRAPLIVSWPRRLIGKEGGIRRQLVDAVDIAPTLLDAAGTRFAKRAGGQQQLPVAGHSFVPTFASARAAGPRSVQFFELRGNRAITSGNWRAVAMHRPGTSFDEDVWELFDLSRDFSESHNVAAQHPARLRSLQALWQREARKFMAPQLREPSDAVALLNRYDDYFADEK